MNNTSDSTAKEKGRQGFRRRDRRPLIFLLLLLLLIAAGCGAVILKHKLTPQTHYRYANVYLKGKPITSCYLDPDAPVREFTIGDPSGDYNIIRVENGCIGVVESNCPNHQCMDFGMCPDSSVPICCLPHELIITFTDEPVI